jgi:sugar phosphate isomerase/epimerase
MHQIASAAHLNRRHFLLTSAATVGALTALRAAEPPAKKKPTEFQIACMTLPYARFSLERALSGIKSAGYRYVAWGTTHVNAPGGKPAPILAADDPPEKAKDLAARCREIGLEPLMMFSMVYPEAKDGLTVLKSRLQQASAAKMPHVLTFGHTKGGNKQLWLERFKELAPIAKDLNVTLVIKQHGGETGTGEACAEITREVNHPNIKVNFDAGNVMDYLHIDPIADLKKCVDEVRGFCIKDHRMAPKDEDCGPGLGEIDHYKLLQLVAFMGLTMPLCCENIFAPLLPRPEQPEGVDVLAKRAREFLELVIAGLQK